MSEKPCNTAIRSRAVSSEFNQTIQLNLGMLNPRHAGTAVAIRAIRAAAEDCLHESFCFSLTSLIFLSRSLSILRGMYCTYAPVSCAFGTLKAGRGVCVRWIRYESYVYTQVKAS